MAPTIVYDANGKVVLVIGAAGGPTIPVTVTRAIIGVLDFGMGAQDALAMPFAMSFGEALLIDELARQFGFGVRNFKRRFKDATGYTPIAYLQTLRLEQAKQLLETTQMSLDSITYKVGYEDSNSFRRLFLKRVGLLPTAYRRKFQAAG